MTSPKKIAASCLILAGGKGRRLTPDKPLLRVGGISIIERVARVTTALFDEVIVVTNSPGKYEFLGLPLVADDRPHCGPLMGIYSGLRRTRHEAAFVCAADMPFLNAALIRAEFEALGDFDVVVPWPRKRPQFLHAFYRRRCLPTIREHLEKDLYKVETVTERCRTRRLDRAWFARAGFEKEIDRAFTNINTAEDYRRWAGNGLSGRYPGASEEMPTGEKPSTSDPLASIAPDLVREIRRTLIEQETAYQNQASEEVFSSIWAHSSRVGRIACRIAEKEGWDPEPALLSGLLHDIGKFAHGTYHENDTPEEEDAARFVEDILSGTVYEKWIPEISAAVLSTYLEGETTSDTGKAVYDADCLDKLGNMGVVQFFAKRALRRQFLNEEVLIRTSVELTYAHHAPDTLKTPTGRALARERRARTRRFYTELLEEWAQLGLGGFTVVEEEIAGIVCILVVPTACACGTRLDRESDIQDAVKCRSVVVHYRCPACGFASEFSFCLPNIQGLPRIRHDS